MKQYIDKSALVAEIERITDVQQEICKADVALGKAPDSKNIEVIYQFQQFTKFLDTLEVKEIGVDIDSPEGDYNSKTVQFIDADGNIKEIKFNKAQNGKSALEAIKKEKINNQNCVKPADKVEPKFHENDWIIGANNVFKIISLNDKLNCYIAVTPSNEEVKIPYQFDDGQGHMCSYHLWTIQDAKAGDVLCGYPEADYPWIGIFCQLNADYTFNSYCYLQAGLHGKFCLPSGENIFGKRNVDNHSLKNIVPATKEQRDLLFSKMKEAGYEWDAENKELKKIEQKHACSDDKKLTDVNHEYFNELLENNNSKDINDYVYQVAYCMSHDWIEETATWDDVQKACKLGAEWKEKHCNNSSTAWSEEDEKMLNQIIKDYERGNESWLKGQGSLPFGNRITWLKSLRPQNTWKPSDEQLNNLKQAINAFPYETDYLELLYDDLKKLKGE